MRNHYSWLTKYFNKFANKAGLKGDNDYLIGTHGDKCVQAKPIWISRSIPFHHGVAIYLLTYRRPYSKEVRVTEKGWIDPFKWVINNYQRFSSILEEVEHERHQI
jgi:hypothetical protein